MCAISNHISLKHQFLWEENILVNVPLLIKLTSQWHIQSKKGFIIFFIFFLKGFRGGCACGVVIVMVFAVSVSIFCMITVMSFSLSGPL